MDRQFEKLSAEVFKFTHEASAEKSRVATKARRDFAKDIYNALAEENTKGSRIGAYASTHSTWPSIIRAAIQHTSKATVSKDQWIAGIAAAMLATSIEWVPGSHSQRLTHRRVVHLVGSTAPPILISAPPGSLKRKAIEAEARMASNSAGPSRQRRQQIDFGCKIPFRTIPKLIQNGFSELRRIFANKDQQVLAHYCTAYYCLESCLGDPRCDLMLMLVLTIAASTETPEIKLKERSFSVGKRKDPALLAANMVTRMLWFLQPEAFPWEKNKGEVLRVSEMVKKLGKYWSAYVWFYPKTNSRGRA